MIKKIILILCYILYSNRKVIEDVKKLTSKSERRIKKTDKHLNKTFKNNSLKSTNELIEESIILNNNKYTRVVPELSNLQVQEKKMY